ncbi:MAG: phosphopantetheine-binding protein, partial [Pseudomonadota bacterium]
HRIEPGEIEAVLLQHPRVSQAAVVAQRTARGDRQLAAFVVLAPSQGDDDRVDPIRTLAAHLAEHLPAHLNPASIHAFDALPLDPFDRVDREALCDPAGNDAAASLENADDGRLEAIARIVEGVLGMPVPDADARLLDLGADSVAMIRIANEIEEMFGHRPGLEFLFQNPSLRDLGNDLSAALGPEFRAEDGARGEWS